MRIGIDIGGSHLGVGLVNEDGIIIQKKETDIVKEKNLTEAEIVVTLIETINEMLKQSQVNISEIDFVGVAYPAKIQNGKMGIAVNLKLDGDKIKNTLQNQLSLPVHIKNDAKCASICEKMYGSLKPYRNAIFLTLGTGIGGAVYYNNELLENKDSEIFEIGHMIIEKNGKQCNCGKKGCFEKYASIIALKEQVKVKFVLQKELTGLELYNFIQENKQNQIMQNIIKEYIENLKIGISNLITIFEPEAISFGGSFAYYEEIFLEKLQKELKNSNSNNNIPKLLIAENKNDAGIIGACWFK